MAPRAVAGKADAGGGAADHRPLAHHPSGPKSGIRIHTAVTPPSPPRRETWTGPVVRLLWRIALIGGVALLAGYLLDLSLYMAETLPDAQSSSMQVMVLLAALIVYGLLIATPFVPGIEIGVALLMLRGASIAPAVYCATFLGLALAFLLGHFLKKDALSRLLMDLRLRRAGEFVAHLTQLSMQSREAELQRMLPRWISVPILRYRYLSLAVLLNVPGNVVLGGGGGLMIMAGMSRLYRPMPCLATIAIAVMPVPLVIWWFGTGMLTLPPTH